MCDVSVDDGIDALPIVSKMWRPCNSDPFYSREPKWTFYEVVKTFFTTIILLVPRIVIAFVLHFLVFLVVLLSTLFMSKQRLKEPLPKISRWLLSISQLLSRLLLFTWGFLWIKKKKLKATDMENPALWSDTTKATVQVANHVSMIDIYYFICRSLPGQVSKAAVGNIPFAGRIARAFQCIFVDRKDKDSRNTVLEEIRRRALMTGFNPVLIYAEGTITSGEQLIEFKRGAFAPGVPVQPICLRYPFKHHNVSWNQQKAGSVLLRILLQFVNYIHVTDLPVAIPTEEEKANPDLFTARVRTAMARAMGVPMTEHSYPDFGVCRTFRKNKLKQKLEVAELKAIFGPRSFDPVLINALVDRYMHLNLKTEDKVLSREDFIAGLQTDYVYVAHVPKKAKKSKKSKSRASQQQQVTLVETSATQSLFDTWYPALSAAADKTHRPSKACLSRVFSMMNVEHQYDLSHENPHALGPDQMQFRSFALSLTALSKPSCVMSSAELAGVVFDLLDWDGDGKVQASDVLRVMASYGAEVWLKNCESQDKIPEPAQVVPSPPLTSPSDAGTTADVALDLIDQTTPAPVPQPCIPTVVTVRKQIDGIVTNLLSLQSQLSREPFINTMTEHSAEYGMLFCELVCACWVSDVVRLNRKPQDTVIHVPS